MSLTALIRVLIADPYPLYLDALSRVVHQCSDIELAGEATDGVSALERIRRDRPDVAVVAANLPKLDALGVLRALGHDQISTRVVVVGDPGASTGAYDAMAEGAAGYLSKHVTEDQLGDTIRRVARGDTVIAPDAQRAVAVGIRTRERGAGDLLTAREREVLGFVALGMSIPQIGRALHLSPATVKTHQRHLYEKLGVSDRAAAVAQAMRRGLLE